MPSALARELNEGEEVVFDLKPHWWYFWKHLAFGLVLLGFAFLLWQASDSSTVEDVGWWAWSLAALVFAAWLVYKYLDWSRTNFVVTTQRVKFRSGLIRRGGVQIPLTRISNINFEQGIIDRAIGAGDLVIESAGESGQTVFEDVRHPNLVQAEIYKQMRRADVESTQPIVHHVAPQSVSDELAKLAELQAQGHLTPEEFQQAKARLLAGPGGATDPATPTA